MCRVVRPGRVVPAPRHSAFCTRKPLITHTRRAAPERCTPNLARRTRRSEPSAPNPALRTPQSALRTQNPALRTPNPEPSTNPAPSALNPEPVRMRSILPPRFLRKVGPDGMIGTPSHAHGGCAYVGHSPGGDRGAGGGAHGRSAYRQPADFSAGIGLNGRAAAFSSRSPELDGSGRGGRVLPEAVRADRGQDDVQRLRGGEDRQHLHPVHEGHHAAAERADRVRRRRSGTSAGTRRTRVSTTRSSARWGFRSRRCGTRRTASSWTCRATRCPGCRRRNRFSRCAPRACSRRARAASAICADPTAR